MTTPATAPGQHLMLAWLSLMRQYTPDMRDVGKAAWMAWHTQLKQQTSQFLAEQNEELHGFTVQVISLQLLVDEWIGEKAA
jgi:hypothetical protein